MVNIFRILLMKIINTTWLGVPFGLAISPLIILVFKFHIKNNIGNIKFLHETIYLTGKTMIMIRFPYLYFSLYFFLLMNSYFPFSFKYLVYNKI
jgi:hypothetical protein